MGWDDDDGLHEFVESLVNGGYLEGAALGIAKKIVNDSAPEDLSPAQQDIFYKYVLGPYESTCLRCSNSVPWRDKIGDPYKNICNDCHTE
ncbi:MAG: hypothetical protein M1537_02160 [Nitrospirae bacterium]|jgi:hypothetical protein|nr:hypothetical protein [Nitrospirota bacterium]